MKNLLKIKFLVLAGVLGLFLTSCDDEDPPVPIADTSITGLAKTNANLSILVQALVRADLAGTLSGSGPFTVFAPTNAAFTEFLSENNFADINAVPVPFLREVLLNHVVSGTALAADLTNNTYIKTLGKGSASTTNTLSMYVEKTSIVILNGEAVVTTPNITANNGVIHIVDDVIGLPTIVTHADANPNFSTLFTIVTSPAQAAVATALTTNTSPLTVFAPTNTAFTTATVTGAWANGATSAQLTKVLQYHVTGGNVLAASLTNGQVIPMITNPVQNISIDLSVAGTARINDTSTTKATIIVTNVQCANGIIHAVDKVLQPVL